MGKPKKPDKTPITGGGGLGDSPFASLAGLNVPKPAPGTAPGAVEAGAETPASSKSKSRGRVVLRRETKHRGGKAVVIVSGLGALEGFDPGSIEELARQLKHQLGCGGTVEAHGADLEIVLQGDRAAKVAELLRAWGFRVDGVTA